MPKRQKKNRGPRNLEPVLEPEASHVVTRYDTQETEPGPKAKPNPVVDVVRQPSHVPSFRAQTSSQVPDPSALSFRDIHYQYPTAGGFKFDARRYVDIEDTPQTPGVSLVHSILLHYMPQLDGNRKILYAYEHKPGWAAVSSTFPEEPVPQPLYTWVDKVEQTSKSMSAISVGSMKDMLRRLNMKDEIVSITESNPEFPIPSDIMWKDIGTDFEDYVCFEWEPKGEPSQAKKSIEHLQAFLFPETFLQF